MNPARLDAYFNRISDASEAVSHFRQFIIDLSVRGKLVEQDPSDEPASELLDRIKKEWKRLYRETKSTNDKISTEIQKVEKPYSLPNNWQWIRLGECLEMINGRAFKPTDWLPAGLPIVRIQNLNNENAPFNYCDESSVEQRHIIESGCFLIMASLAATTLLWRGTPLDRLWTFNPTAYKQLAPLGRIVGILFLVLGAALTTAAIGWFRRRLWGWRLAVVIISTQVLGDIVNCVRGDWLRGGTGVIIAGALLLFLLQPRIRAAFA